MTEFIEGHLIIGDGLVVLTNGENGDDFYEEIRNAAAATYHWNVGDARSHCGSE